MQAPERPGAPAAYRVVPERDLAAALASLTAEGFVPRATARTVGMRHQVVFFERTSPTAAADEWRVLSFDTLEDLTTVASAAAAVTIERQTSFGLLGSGPLVGAGIFWNDYLAAWRPAERRQLWGSPVLLSKYEATCPGLALKLRIDGMDDQAHDIVALLGKPRAPDGYEVLVVAEQRLGSSSPAASRQPPAASH